MKIWGTSYQAGTRAIEAYKWIRRYSVNSLKGKLTKKELSAIVDSLNGSMFEDQFAINHVAFIAHLEDADKFESLGVRWGINIDSLKKKIEKMSPAEIYFLQEEINRFWTLESENGYGSPNPALEKLLNFLC
jgi:hypothetical protein